MVSLLDIAPLSETVKVPTAKGDVKVDVYGVSAAGLVSLLARFPEIRMMMTGKEVEVDRLMAMGGEAVAAIIAAGCGHPGDDNAEQNAARLSLEAQTDLLSAIVKLTLPNGLGPFVSKLTALMGTAGAGAEVLAEVRATKSPKQ